MKKYRNAGGVAVPAAPMRIEEDHHDEHDEPPQPPNNHKQTTTTTTTLLLHRPVPVRVTEAFYEATRALPFDEVQCALRASHEWHCKYTGNQADPMAMMLLNSNNGNNESNCNEEMARMVLMDDREGAKNPSPSGGGGEDVAAPSSSRNLLLQQQHTKRLRGPSSSLEEDDWEETKQDEHDDEDTQEAPSTLKRPVAVRVTVVVQRPVACRVPQHILHEQERAHHNMSPISMDSSHFQPQQTLLPPQAAPCVIEFDDEPRRMAPRLLLQESLSTVQQARDGLLHALAVSGGDTDSTDFTRSLQVLQEHYSNTSNSNSNNNTQGTWLTLTKPSFFDCLGDNDQGDPLYTLARMSFNMFQPANLICSLQGNFNCVERVTDKTDVTVPKSLREAVGGDATVLRTYK